MKPGGWPSTTSGLSNILYKEKKNYFQFLQTEVKTDTITSVTMCLCVVSRNSAGQNLRASQFCFLYGRHKRHRAFMDGTKSSPRTASTQAYYASHMERMTTKGHTGLSFIMMIACGFRNETTAFILHLGRRICRFAFSIISL